MDPVKKNLDRYDVVWAYPVPFRCHVFWYLPSTSKFFYWIQLAVLLVFFAKGSGCGRLHAHSICDATCTSENKWMYRILLSGVSDFWKSFLFVSATKNLMYHIFFIRYIRFVLIRNLFLFEDPRYMYICFIYKCKINPSYCKLARVLFGIVYKYIPPNDPCIGSDHDDAPLSHCW